MSLRLPILTERHESLDQFTPQDGSVYVFATSPEERSAHSPEWETRAHDVRFVRLGSDDRSFPVFVDQGEEVRVSLRSARGLREFWSRHRGREVYLDITGLGHHIWAPLLRAAVREHSDVRVVYVEPTDYTQSSTPTEGEIFDLSEAISGIAPIPGFASLARGDDDDFDLVVLLGFEGTRLAYLLENVQPRGGRVIPLIGAPGFRPEYPFYTYHGNKSALRESRAWTHARFAAANCPFRVFYELESIAESIPRRLKVAPIGTKPHSLGAVLYAIAEDASVELVYDHPIRTAKRTVGAARALVYHVSPLLADRRL